MSAKVAIRLNWMKRALESFSTMRARLEHVADEAGGFIFSDGGDRDLEHCLDDLEAIMGEAKLHLEAEYTAYYSQFDHVAVLQPLVRCGDAEKRIVVVKPRLPKRDEPYIRKDLYDVFLRQMGGTEIVNLDGYDIEIVDEGRAVGRIRASNVV